MSGGYAVTDHDTRAAMWSGPFEDLVKAQLTMAPDGRLRHDDVLADLGLDSLGAMALLMELEEAYEIVFPDELLVPATFATPGALWSSLCTLTGWQM
jgi:acyl carrier protein